MILGGDGGGRGKGSGEAWAGGASGQRRRRVEGGSGRTRRRVRDWSKGEEHPEGGVRVEVDAVQQGRDEEDAEDGEEEGVAEEEQKVPAGGEASWTCQWTCPEGVSWTRRSRRRYEHSGGGRCRRQVRWRESARRAARGGGGGGSGGRGGRRGEEKCLGGVVALSVSQPDWLVEPEAEVVQEEHVLRATRPPRRASEAAGREGGGDARGGEKGGGDRATGEGGSSAPADGGSFTRMRRGGEERGGVGCAAHTRGTWPSDLMWKQRGGSLRPVRRQM